MSGTLTEGEGPPCTNLFRSTAFHTENIFFFFTKQSILMRRSTVLVLSLQKELPGSVHSRSFQPCIILMGKVPILPAKIRLGWKELPATNTLAYFENFVNYDTDKFYYIGPRSQSNEESLKHICSLIFVS